VYWRRQLAIPACAFPTGGDHPTFFLTRFAGVLAIELPGNCAGGVDQAGASLPASPAFFKFAGARIFGMNAFAFLPMATIQFERHIALTRLWIRFAR